MAHYKGAASEAGRAMQLMKKREQQMQDIEIRKKRIEEDLRVNNIENKFATHYDAVEQQLKVRNLHLVVLGTKSYPAELDNWAGDAWWDEGKTGEHRKGAWEEAGTEAAREGAWASQAPSGQAGGEKQAKTTGKSIHMQPQSRL